MTQQSTSRTAGPPDPADDRAAPAPAAPAEPRIRITDLFKGFKRLGGGHVPAVDGISLDVAAGEFLVLLGPSGCGKTTLLRCLAGLETPDSGEVVVSGSTVYSSTRGIALPPERRPTSMMFQSYALWPHMTAHENVAFPLKSHKQGRKRSRQEIQGLVDEVMAMVGVPELAHQYPGQMSGGQQQRVALARSLVAGDEVILFDEPLSNVDAKVRDQLRFELLGMQRRLGFTAVYVTHDQHEAMSLATTIAVLNEGRIEQVGTPREIYGDPATPYVARFVGTTNELPGSVDGSGSRVRTAIGDVAVGGSPAGADVLLSTRPERWRISAGEPGETNRWRGVVELAMYLGSRNEYVVAVGSQRLVVWDGGTQLLDQGAPVWVAIAPEDVRVLSAAPVGAGTS